MTYVPTPLKAENNYNTLVDSLEQTLYCPPEEDHTVQADAIEADINEIVRRFGITGQMPPPRPGAEYGDFSEVMDFQSALDALNEAQEAFDALPAKLRERFTNDPAKFLDFLSDDDNYDEAVKLGVLDPTAVAARNAPPSGDPPPADDPSGDPPAD